MGIVQFLTDNIDLNPFDDGRIRIGQKDGTRIEAGVGVGKLLGFIPVPNADAQVQVGQTNITASIGPSNSGVTSGKLKPSLGIQIEYPKPDGQIAVVSSSPLTSGGMLLASWADQLKDTVCPDGVRINTDGTVTTTGPIQDGDSGCVWKNKEQSPPPAPIPNPKTTPSQNGPIPTVVPQPKPQFYEGKFVKKKGTLGADEGVYAATLNGKPVYVDKKTGQVVAPDQLTKEQVSRMGSEFTGDRMDSPFYNPSGTPNPFIVPGVTENPFGDPFY